MFTIIFYLIVILLVVTTNRLYGFDKSIGETKPKFTDKATYPKFYVHWVTAVTITWFMWLTGLSWTAIFILMAFAIPAYEWSQKFFNKLDMLAGVVGIATTYVAIYVFL